MRVSQAELPASLKIPVGENREGGRRREKSNRRERSLGQCCRAAGHLRLIHSEDSRRPWRVLSKGVAEAGEGPQGHVKQIIMNEKALRV